MIYYLGKQCFDKCVNKTPFRTKRKGGMYYGFSVIVCNLSYYSNHKGNYRYIKKVIILQNSFDELG